MSQNMSVVRCEGQSTITFKNNIASFLGGTVHSIENSNIFLMHYSTVLFYSNSARLGDTIYTNYNSLFSITSNSTVRFNNNAARWYGGVPYSNRHVDRKFCWGVLFKEMWTFSYCSHSANHSPGAGS